MNYLLKTIFTILVSSLTFTILLRGLYKSNPKMFLFMKEIPESWRGKYFIRWIVLFILMVFVSLIVVIGGLNETLGIVIIGFFISFTDLIFDKPKSVN